jgi:hypothetical protein
VTSGLGTGNKPLTFFYSVPKSAYSARRRGVEPMKTTARKARLLLHDNGGFCNRYVTKLNKCAM